MSVSHDTGKNMQNTNTIPNNGQFNTSEEQIIQDTYATSTTSPNPSTDNGNVNEPVAMEDTVRESNELALTGKDDVETAKNLVRQQNIDIKYASASSSSPKTPKATPKDKSREEIKKDDKTSNRKPTQPSNYLKDKDLLKSDDEFAEIKGVIFLNYSP